MTFNATDPQSHQSENTWYTPKQLINCFGDFDLDPCTLSTRPFDTAKNHYCNDLGQDGLTLDWKDQYGRLEYVWMNPPYGKEMDPWIDKFIDHRFGVCLVFARTGNKSIQKLLSSNGYAYFFRNKIRFIDKFGNIAKHNPGTDSMLYSYNGNDFDDSFIKKFKGILIKCN